MNSSPSNISGNPSTTSPILQEQIHNPWDDAVWILTCAFIIFTMQSGFGLLESGMVSRKHEINILVKNVADVLFGGLSFWMFGYALSFGDSPGSNPIVGFGSFFVDAEEDDMGHVFSRFFFQASFATTATTIVSGAMAERVKLESYCLFSFLSTIIFCLPAHWIWASNGWLRTLGCVDEAGACAVHLVGGISGLVATVIIKPRSGRFDDDNEIPKMGSPATALLGLFMLWWGWLAFNCGSTFGVTNGKWKIAARAAVVTIIASIAGGMTAIVCSYVTKRRKVDVKFIIRGVLGSLVSVTAICGLTRPWSALLIGLIGGALGCYGSDILARVHVDDPVGSIGVHSFPAIWSMISVGLFIESEPNSGKNRKGLFVSGDLTLLGLQIVAVIAVVTWCAISAGLILFCIDKTAGLRVSFQEEVLGADIVEHTIGGYVKARRGGVSQLNPIHLPEHDSQTSLGSLAVENINERLPSHLRTIQDNLAYLQSLAASTYDQADDDCNYDDEMIEDDIDSLRMSPEVSLQHASFHTHVGGENEIARLSPKT